MDTADILIHVHPELSAEARAMLENEVAECDGIVTAKFDHHKHPHALIVLYNPDVIDGKGILEVVRKHDSAATMVGL